MKNKIGRTADDQDGSRNHFYIKSGPMNRYTVRNPQFKYEAFP
jgi:hypothetical protein